MNPDCFDAPQKGHWKRWLPWFGAAALVIIAGAVSVALLSRARRPESVRTDGSTQPVAPAGSPAIEAVPDRALHPQGAAPFLDEPRTDSSAEGADRPVSASRHRFAGQTIAAPAVEVAVVPGDLNADGKLTVRDVVLLQHRIENGVGSTEPARAGDLDGDGVVSETDLVELQRRLMASP